MAILLWISWGVELKEFEFVEILIFGEKAELVSNDGDVNEVVAIDSVE